MFFCFLTELEIASAMIKLTYFSTKTLFAWKARGECSDVPPPMSAESGSGCLDGGQPLLWDALLFYLLCPVKTDGMVDPDPSSKNVQTFIGAFFDCIVLLLKQPRIAGQIRPLGQASLELPEAALRLAQMIHLITA